MGEKKTGRGDDAVADESEGKEEEEEGNSAPCPDRARTPTHSTTLTALYSVVAAQSRGLRSRPYYSISGPPSLRIA